MRANALKKQEFLLRKQEVYRHTAKTQPVPPVHKGQAVKYQATVSWEAWRMEIAAQAEAACCLPGNLNAPDMEEFLMVDGKPASSNFA